MHGELLDLSWEEYRALDAVNASLLKDVHRDPALALCRKEISRATKAMELGSAFHVASLEPNEFAVRYAIWPGHRRGKEWKEFEATNTDKIILTETEVETVCGMADSLKRHPIAGSLLETDGHVEASLIWTHPRTDRKIKNRADKIVNRTLVDLKRVANLDAFAYDAGKFLYDLQMSLYADGCAACGLEIDHVLLLCVEPTPPYRAAVFPCEEETFLGYGREKYEEALDTLARCEALGMWPSKYDAPQPPLVLPARYQPELPELEGVA